MRTMPTETATTNPGTASPQRLLYVDALRGLAALTVLFHHTTTQFPSLYGHLAPDWPQWHRALMFLSDRNHDAVLLFFVLSGFSVRLSSGRKGLDSRADIDLYLYRRFKRILPLFLAALALTAGLGAWTGHIGEAAFAPWTLLGNLTFLQSSANTRGTWFVPYGGNGPLWSLSYEVFYYLLFPAMLFALARFKMATRTAMFALATILTALGFAAFVIAPAPPFAFLSLFGVWYCGADLAEQHLKVQKDSPFVIAALLGGVVMAVVASNWIPSATLQSWAVGAAIYCMWRVGLSVSPKQPESKPRRASIWSPLARLGFISYAVYLFHYPMLTAAAAIFDQSWLVLAVTVALALTLAWGAELLAAKPRYAFLKLNYLDHRQAQNIRRA
jgi:peptidoglycan/LPS O-acetylase OafA/YrhL